MKMHKFTTEEIEILKDALNALKDDTIGASEGGYLDTPEKMRDAVVELDTIKKLQRRLRK